MITLTPDEGANGPILRVAGDLTIYNAAALATDLLGRLADGARVDLDLDEVTELDTAGLQVLLVARREAKTRGQSMHWLRPSAPVVQVIETFQLAHLLDQPACDEPPDTLPATPDEGLEP
jgi:anti-sigma B factor antagonist